jgi:hypothetical protein
MTYNNSKLKSLINNPEIDKYLRGVAEEIANDIKLEMLEVSPGRQYGDHIASRPGDVPNVDTGNLRQSIDWYREKTNTMIIHDGVPYGIELEIGTSQVAARPFMRPQFTWWKNNIAKDFIKQQVIK